ncbi:MAG: M43 family zinc metalloprotease [Bacteroidia bacterium]
MKRKQLLLILLLCISGLCWTPLRANPASDSIPCGFDQLITLLLRDSAGSATFDSVRACIRRKVESNNQQYHIVQQANNYVIPVVVHLIGTNVSNAITDAAVINQIALLNQGFANQLGSPFPYADDAQITFCLAQTTATGVPWTNYNSTTNGITRTTSAAANTMATTHNMNATGAGSQQALTNIIYFNPTRYLNIWVVEQISQTSVPYVNSVVGYSPFPLMNGLPNQFLDGVVMRASSFGVNPPNPSPNYNQGRVLIHEIGHYLGLFHTFQFGCSEVINGTPCNSSGDECCDTPPVAAANQADCSALAGANSCAENPNLPDMIENHMDYAYDNANTCRNTFTDEQANRMHATIQLYRSVLVSVGNLISTGLTSATGCLANFIDPTFITTLPGGTTQVCVGQAVGFQAVNGASSYSWTFPAGVPGTATGTSNPTGITWAAAGMYNVSLTITDGNGTSYSSTLQIFVTTCTPYAGERANWYFGHHWGISFATGTAVPSLPSSITSLESAASVSSSAGQLLFYTDGRTVYNSTHAIMQNGNATLNGGINNAGLGSSAQGALIAPRPGNPNHYYVFTTPGVDNSAAIQNGITYYEIDMSANGGLGNVLNPNAGVHPTQNYSTTEPLLAVPQCNGTDFWLVVKPVNNNHVGLPNPGPNATPDNVFMSYSLTSAGLANIPVTSNAGAFSTPQVYPGGNTWIGGIAVSPNKNLIAYSDLPSQQTHLYNFDCATGILNYLTTINAGGYSACFSPNSRVLYLSNSNSLTQYDLANLSPCNTNIPSKLVTTVSNAFGGEVQLGPDNRVYFSINRFNVSGPVGCVNFPNVVNVTNSSNDCGYNGNAVQPLAGTVISKSCLPNDIIGSFAPMTDDFSFCVRNCSEAIFTNLGCGTNFTWNFGDGYSITGPNGTIPNGTNNGTTTGNFEYPHHTFAATGNYIVTLSIDGHPVVTHTVSIVFPPVPTITGPNPVCNTNSLPVSYFGPAGYQYAWTVTNGTPTTGNLQTINVVWTSFPGTITLVITDPNTGCTNTNTITVTQATAAPVVNAGPDLNICPGGSVPINATVSNGSITWSPTNGLSCINCPNPVANPGATTTYTITASNGCGASSDVVTVNVTTCGFTITKTSNVTQTYAGHPIQYTITVCNNTGGPANITLSDQLPPNFVIITTPPNFPNFPGYPVASTINNLPTGCTDFVYSGYFTTNGLCPDPDHTNNVTLTGGGQQYTASNCVTIMYGCPMIVYGNSDCVLGNPVPVVIGVHTPIPAIKRMNLQIVYPSFIAPPTSLTALNTFESFVGQNIDFANSSIVTNPSIYTTIAGVDYYVTTINIVYDNPVSVIGPYSFATINFTYVNPIPPCETSHLCWAIAPYSNTSYHVDLYQTGATTPTFSPWTQGYHIFFSGCPGCTAPDAGFTVQQTPCDGHGCVTVTATNTSPTATHIWDFDDYRATPFNGAPIKTWCYFDDYIDNVPSIQSGLPPGTYYIKHTVIDNGAMSELIQAVNVLPPCCQQNVMISDGTYSSSLGGLLQSTTVDITGEFFVDQTFVFSNCTVTMEPGAKITVMNQSTLMVDNSTIEACSNMWQGIYVESGSNCTVRRSRIMDAQYAVYANDGSSIGFYSSTFDRNFVSLYIPQSSLGYNVVGELIDDCTFTNSSSLHAPFTGQTPAPTTNSFAGIQAYDAMIDLTGLGTNSNHFSRMSNGVVTSRCNVRVARTDFRNIYADTQYNPLVTYNGTGINCQGGHGYFSLRQTGYGSTGAASFDNCNRGIYAKRMNVDSRANKMTRMNYGYGIDNGSNMVIDVIDNYIYCNLFGMILRYNDHARHLLVQSNAIHFGYALTQLMKGVDAIRVMESNGDNPDSKIHGNSIYYNPGATNAANGINMYSATRYQVTSNTLTMTNNVINRNGIITHGCIKDEVSCNTVIGSYTAYNNDKYQSAIKVDMGDGHTVSCNTVDGTINGIYFNGYAYSTDVKGNNINEHTWGLHLSPYTIIGSQYWKGNQWFVPAVGSGVNAIYEDLNNAAVYKFNYDPGSSPGPTVEPMSWYPSYWFFNQGNANFECANSGGYCNQFARVDCPSCTRDYDIRIAQERISNGTYTDESFFSLARALFEKLQQNPEYRDSFPVLDSFYVANEGGMLSILKEIGDGSNSMYNMDPQVANNVIQNVQMIDLNHDDLRQHLDLILSGTLTDAQLASERAIIAGYMNTISNLVSYNNTALDLAANTRILSSDNVRQLNNSLATSEIIEENERQVNEIYLSTIARDEDEFSRDQIDILYRIANQCPLAGGNAVWKARALYSSIDEEAEYDDLNTCLANGISLREIGGEELLASTSIYPNPTSGSATLVYSLENEADGRLEIYNSLGKIVATYHLDWKANQFEFSSLQLRNGVYNYKVISKNTLVGVGKFSVIK